MCIVNIHPCLHGGCYCFWPILGRSNMQILNQTCNLFIYIWIMKVESCQLHQENWEKMAETHTIDWKLQSPISPYLSWNWIKNNHDNVSFLESFRIGGFSTLSITLNAKYACLCFNKFARRFPSFWHNYLWTKCRHNLVPDKVLINMLW